jgi:hypothetical protein
MTGLSLDPLWWISVVELPALAGLFVMQQRLRRDVEALGLDTREALSDFKLEVARTYASLDQMKDVEVRLTEHLLRIEAKLDQAAVRRDGRP